MHQKARSDVILLPDYPDMERHPDGLGLRLTVSVEDAHAMVASLTSRARNSVHDLLRQFGCVVLTTDGPVELRRHKGSNHVLHTMHARTGGSGATAWHKDQADYLALRVCKNTPADAVGPTGIASMRMVEEAIEQRIGEITAFVEQLPTVTEARRLDVLYRLRAVAHEAPHVRRTGKEQSNRLWQATQQLPHADRGAMQIPLTAELKQKGALYEHRWNGHSVLLVDDNAVLHCNLSTGIDEAPSDMERLKVRL